MHQALTESAPAEIELTAREAEALRRLGQELRGASAFWRARVTDASDDKRSALTLETVGGSRYRLTVWNAVGVIAVADRLFEIHPKIPFGHFLHLLRLGETLPRTTFDASSAALDETLWDLVCRWAVEAIDGVMRKGLLSDYSAHRDLLFEARGTLLPLTTANAFYAGQMALACEYDEFTLDNDLNRVLLGATRTIAASGLLPTDLRRRARRQGAMMDGVGTLQSRDLGLSIDRRSAFYADAVELARHVLSGHGRAPRAGEQRAWSFLVPTPLAIEAGIRHALAKGLGPSHKVDKRGRLLPPTTMTLNPDLVFSARAVGDVKYKLVGKEWNRSDLYQAVTFAVGYGVSRAAVVAFRSAESSPPPVRVGNVDLTVYTWDCSAAPEEAESALVGEIRDWLEYPKT